MREKSGVQGGEGVKGTLGVEGGEGVKGMSGVEGREMYITGIEDNYNAVNCCQGNLLVRRWKARRIEG